MSTDTPVFVPVPRPKTGLAIASLVLGILAVCLSLFLVGGAFGLVGLALGGVYLARRTPPRAMAVWGTALSVVGLIAALGFGFMFYRFVCAVKESMDDRASSGPDIETWEGVTAPDFTVRTLDGQEWSLAAFRGKRVVVDVWATWCPPCRKEIPHFVELFNQTSRDDLAIVGVSSEDEKALRAFAGKEGISYPVASAKDLPAPYGSVQSIPTTFFIDRNGVIQSIRVGYNDLETLKADALAADREGPARAAPAPPPDLRDAKRPLKATKKWSTDTPGGAAICAGDWDGDGATEIIVAAGTGATVLDMNGAKKSTVGLPASFAAIEIGRHPNGPRLLGHGNWGKAVSVVGADGKLLWSWKSLTGVNGAHWGDLDGDGTDELVVGMNGFAGMDVVSADGKKLWSVKKIGNVWNQAVISQAPGRPARVFATEAGGSIKVYDAAGQKLTSLRPEGRYCAQMSAAVVDASNTIQIVAIGDGRVIACDVTGAVQWSGAGVEDHGGWRTTTFSGGDLNSDGVFDWVYPGPGGKLVIASSAGEKLAELSDLGEFEGFAVAGPLLVVLSGDKVDAYSFR